MKFLMLLLFLPATGFSQDLTGVWTGFLYVEDTRLPYELVISGKNNDLTGYSMTVFTFNGVENVGVKTMEMKVKRGSISIEDGELVYDNYSTPGRKVKLYGTLAWVGKDSSMTLAGTFSTRSMDMRALNANAFKGTVKLQKKGKLVRTKLMEKLAEMNLLPTLSFIKPVAKKPVSFTKPKDSTVTAVKATPAPPRQLDVIRSVQFKSDSITMSLYDNGEVDGDTVTVILNGKIILSRQGLSTKAIVYTIATSQLGDSSELIMYAETLGRIPPNSGLLVLQDGNERYQIRFSGDLQTNAAIILRRKR